jgi:hypothetical protein
MKSKFAAAILLALPLSFLPLSAALAGERPPTGSKPLSSILKSVEDQKIGSIAQAEFDDGSWKITVCGAAACQKLYLDPRSGKQKRRRKTDAEATPPANAIALSATLQSIEAREPGAVVTEVEFDDGFWEIELRKGRQKIKLLADPMTGQTSPSR